MPLASPRKIPSLARARANVAKKATSPRSLTGVIAGCPATWKRPNAPPPGTGMPEVATGRNWAVSLSARHKAPEVAICAARSKRATRRAPLRRRCRRDTVQCGDESFADMGALARATEPGPYCDLSMTISHVPASSKQRAEKDGFQRERVDASADLLDDDGPEDADVTGEHPAPKAERFAGVVPPNGADHRCLRRAVIRECASASDCGDHRLYRSAQFHLALAVLGVLTVPARIVEPLIAASIVWVAVENLLSVQDAGAMLGGELRVWPGPCPPAAALQEIALPGGESLAWTLLAFNAGVEIGQMIVDTVTAARPAVAARAFLGTALRVFRFPRGGDHGDILDGRAFVLRSVVIHQLFHRSHP